MHLVIWGPLRSGSHMLRSMLADNPDLVDTGEVMQMDALGRHLIEVRRDDKVVLSNIKYGHGLDLRPRVQLLERVNAKVILLLRRDLLAQQASLVLAAKTRAWRSVAPAGTKVRLDPARAGRAMFDTALQFEQLRVALKGLPHAVLAYEDIRVPTVRAALETLGLDLKVTWPRTRKSAPALADYLTNIEETGGPHDPISNS